MFGMGMGEIIVILIVALIVLGPEKLPNAAKAIGRGIRELRKHTRSLQDTIEQDEELGTTVREIRSALRDDPPPMTRPRPVPSPARPLTAVEERYARGEKEPEPEAPKPEPASPDDPPGDAPTGGSTANG